MKYNVHYKIQGTLYGRYEIVGHVPREIFYYFIHHGGMIEGHVADLKKRRSPIPAGGTEIKLKLFFRHTSINKVEKLRGLLSRYKYDMDDDDMMMNLQAAMMQTKMKKPSLRPAMNNCQLII